MKGKVIIKNVMKDVCMRCSAADVERDIDTTRLVLDSSADLKHNTRCETKCPTHTGAEYIDLWGTLGRYLRYLCMLTYSGVQHIVCCGVALRFFFVLCALCFRFLWNCHFWLPLRCSLTFVYLVIKTFIYGPTPVDPLYRHAHQLLVTFTLRVFSSQSVNIHNWI